MTDPGELRIAPDTLLAFASDDPAVSGAEIRRLADQAADAEDERARAEALRVLRGFREPLERFDLSRYAMSGGTAVEQLLMDTVDALVHRAWRDCLAAGSDLTGIAGLAAEPWTGRLPLDDHEHAALNTTHGVLCLRELQAGLAESASPNELLVSADATYLLALSSVLGERAAVDPDRAARGLLEKTYPAASQRLTDIGARIEDVIYLDGTNWRDIYLTAAQDADPRRPLPDLAVRRDRARAELERRLERLA